MVTYTPWWQGFPAAVVDVKSKDPAYPHITIVTKAEAERGEEEDEGWLFIVVDAETIDRELTRKTIAEAIGVKLEDVHLEHEDEDEGIIQDEP
jgi:hypothetical protein